MKSEVEHYKRECISESKLLDPSHRIVKSYFDLLSLSHNFEHIFDSLSQGIGYGLDILICTFPNKDDIESIEEGVGFFWTYDDQHYNENNILIIDNKTFYYYFEIAINYCFKPYHKVSWIEETKRKWASTLNIEL